jgi:hypothetical protein
MANLVKQSVARGAERRKLVVDTATLVTLSRRAREGWIGISGGSDAPARALSTHWPWDELERLVRDKLRRGALFALTSDKYWATPGTGEPCRVCSQPISRGNECQIRVGREHVSAHLVCHHVWWLESQALRRHDHAS